MAFFSQIKVPPTYYLIDSYKKFSWVHKELMQCSEMAFDIETTHPTTKSKDLVLAWERSDAQHKICGVAYAWGRSSLEKSWGPGVAAYIPLLRLGEQPFWGSKQDTILKYIAEIQSNSAHKIAQNGKFDVGAFLQLLNIGTCNFDFDTMLAHSLIDEDCITSTHALKSKFDAKGNITVKGMADAYLELGSSQFKTDLDSALVHYDKRLKRYSKVPLETLYPYGCADADMTLALKYAFDPLLEAEGLTWNFQNILMPLQHRLMLMEMKGVPLDMERAVQVEAEQRGYKEHYAKVVQDLTGHVFNVGSTKQLGTVLFEHLGMPNGRKNTQGWIVDADVLAELDHPCKDPLIKYRRAEQIHGMYAESSLRHAQDISADGKIGWVHTDYFIPSKTGRLKSNNPNLSQLPRSENGGDIVKGLYCCPDDYRFVFMDQSQIELRVIAHLSQEPVWIEGFNAGHDMHAAMAKRAFNLPCSVEEVGTLYKSKRSDAKTINFGIAYGRSEGELAKQLGITLEEANILIHEDYFGGAPVLKQWIEDTHAFAMEAGYVNTIFNRRRHLPDAQLIVPDGLPWPDDHVRPSCYRGGPYISWLGVETADMHSMTAHHVKSLINSNPSNQYNRCMGCPYVVSCVVNRERKYVRSKINGAKRQAVNSPVQGTAVEMVSLCAVWIGDELERQHLDAQPVLHIHDEIGVISHVRDVESTIKIMHYYMTDYLRQFTAFSVPLVADAEVCQRWSDKGKE